MEDSFLNDARIIQLLLGFIVLLIGWLVWMIRGWVSTMQEEQRQQWKWINQNRVDIAGLKGTQPLNDHGGD